MTAFPVFYIRLVTARWQSWYALPLRLIVGYGFMEHGYTKLARGPDSFVAILHALGMPFPALLAWATILVELLGGLAVLAGAFIPIASIPMTAVLLVAIAMVHLPNTTLALWKRVEESACGSAGNDKEPQAERTAWR